MSPESFLKVAIDPGLAVLPESMRSVDARRFLLAICLQESALKYRRQIKGPARGFPMFELGGMKGVLRHPRTQALSRAVLDALEFDGLADRPEDLHPLFEYNDALSIAFARLLIFTLPGKLPVTAQQGWDQYMSAWRPGKPHPSTWAKHWQAATFAVGLES